MAQLERSSSNACMQRSSSALAKHTLRGKGGAMLPCSIAQVNTQQLLLPRCTTTHAVSRELQSLQKWGIVERPTTLTNVLYAIDSVAGRSTMPAFCSDCSSRELACVVVHRGGSSAHSAKPCVA